MSDVPSRKPWIDPTLTLGATIQIGLLLIGLVSYFIAGSGKVEATSDAVKRLEVQVTAQASSTRDSIRESVGRVEAVVTGLQSQVGVLPTMAERVRQFDEAIKRLEDRDQQIQRYLDERRGVLDGRFQALEQRAIEGIADRREMRALLDGLLRASNVNLPGSPGLRR